MLDAVRRCSHSRQPRFWNKGTTSLRVRAFSTWLFIMYDREQGHIAIKSASNASVPWRSRSFHIEPVATSKRENKHSCLDARFLLHDDGEPLDRSHATVGISVRGRQQDKINPNGNSVRADSIVSNSTYGHPHLYTTLGPNACNFARTTPRSAVLSVVGRRR